MRSMVVMALVACGGGDKPTPIETPDAAVEPVPNLTPNQLLTRGRQTIIVGTLGDDASDRAMLGQARFLRDLLPGATIVTDTSIKGAWPANPIVFGGSDVNAALAAIELPMQVDSKQIVVGGQTFNTDGDRVIAAIPAGAKHPAFVLYAGIGTQGIAQINGVRHGGDPLLIADVFGRLQVGSWVRGSDGKVTAKLSERARRLAWRTVERAVSGVAMRVAFPEQIAETPDDSVLVDAAIRGIAKATQRLNVSTPPAMTIYVYPDRRSKQSLTGDQGDGHAVTAGRAVHVVRFDAAGLEMLITHEATHVITGHLWNAAGTALLGEGVAVWTADQYGRVSLSDWRHKLVERPAITSLLSWKGFSTTPEPVTYPLGGLVVATAIELVGFEKFRDQLYGATAETWADACKAAGTTAEALDAAVAAKR